MWLLLSAAAFGADAPEISRSVGAPGGVVVLWPRVIPATEDPALRSLAGQVQSRLKAMVDTAGPGRQVDVRPEPERVCPKAGCDALAVGAVLHHAQGGCVAVVTVQAPGRSEQVLVPFAGVVDFKQPTVPFREPPESSLLVKDFWPCSELLSRATPAEPPVAIAISGALAP